jgi:hypothetical protein
VVVEDEGVAGGSVDPGIEDVDEDRDGGFDGCFDSVLVTGIAEVCFGVAAVGCCEIAGVGGCLGAPAGVAFEDADMVRDGVPGVETGVAAADVDGVPGI